MDNSSRLGRLQRRKLIANSVLGLFICAAVVCALCLVITAKSFAQPGSSGIVSDDFSSGVLDESVWTFINPMGDAACFMTQTALLIDVPNGVSHDPWDVNNAPRLKQAANNTDFEIEAKFDSELTRKFQIQGLFVEQDGQNFIRFDVYSDDTGTYAFSATFSDEDGTGQIKLKTTISGGAPHYLRILRTGDYWSYYYSQDGTDWSHLVRFTHSIAVTAVGFFAGNHGTDADIPAHAGLVDYFFETSAPITPEDGGSNANTVATTIQGLGTVTKTPDLNTYLLGANVSLNAVADPKWTFVGWDGAVTGTQNPVTITVNDNLAVRAIFALAPEAIPKWVHLCSANGDLPTPAPNGGQIDVRIIDLDQNGENDLILTAWDSTESIAWYRRQNGVYSKYIVASTSPTNLTHCINFRDIDGDGDIDLNFGEADLGDRIYWWENPYPNYKPATQWTQRLVRDGPYKKYHDSIWGDFDGDGVEEYVAWNQKGHCLLLFEVPANPRTSGTWPATAIFTWTGNVYDEYSGLAAIDMNLDGKIDLVGGGGWFEHLGGTNFVYHVIDDEMRYGRVAAGQIIPGGRPEVVFALEDKAAPLNFYEWVGTRWVTHCIKPLLARTHTLQLGDVNLDGHLDILTGEMGEWKPFDAIPDNPDATIRVLYGSGTGAFFEQIVNVGQGSLVGQLGDIDLDGDLDIVSKPFGHNIPRLDIWLNTGLDQNMKPLTVNVVGSGSVLKDPAGPLYYLDDLVELTAVAHAGWQFDNWSGDVSGTNNPVLLTITDNHVVTATFVQISDINPPVISNISIIPSATSAVVSWQTDEPTTGSVAYGFSSSYEIGEVLSTVLSTDHSVILSNLNPGTLYHYEITAEDSSSNQSVSDDRIFTTALDLPGIFSDNFDGSILDPGVWTFVNPLGDSSYSLNEGKLLIHVPGGISHDSWMPNRAPRVMQPVENKDFEIKAKFDSELNLQYQLQGLIIEQDSDNFIRYDVVNDGSNVFLFSASFVNGAGTIRFKQTISPAAPYHLRVLREGDQWTLSYSYDGQNWITGKTYSHSLIVTSMGVYGANHGNLEENSPAYTAAIDHFVNTAAPPSGGENARTLTVNVVGSGSVLKDPAGPLYYLDDLVELTAVAHAGWQFDNWSGDVSGTNNPVLLTITDNHVVTATFVQISDTNPPVISNISIIPSATSAVVSWQTDEPTTGSVAYGFSSSYEIGEVLSTVLSTDHSVILSNLNPGTLYHYEITAEDSSSNQSVSDDRIFTTALDPPGIFSDNFDGSILDPGVWTFVNPLGDASYSLSDGKLQIHVPGGISHDPWMPNRAPRVMQPVENLNFEIKAKFDSELNLKYQLQGLIIEQDSDNYICYDVVSGGSNVFLYSNSFVSGAGTRRFKQTISPGAPYHLRVLREGDQWTFSYSYDGQNWITGKTYSHSLTVTSVGVYGANHGNPEKNSPAYTAAIDHFVNIAAPPG